MLYSSARALSVLRLAQPPYGRSAGTVLRLGWRLHFNTRAMQTGTTAWLRQSSSTSKTKETASERDQLPRLVKGAQSFTFPQGLKAPNGPALATSRPVGMDKMSSRDAESSGMFLFRIFFVWGFAITSCLVSLRWIRTKDALREDIAIIARMKVEMDLDHLSTPEWARFMLEGNPSLEQQSILHRANMAMAAKGREETTAELMKRTDHLRNNWHLSLRNWSKGRYHTALSSVFCHSDLKNLAQGAILAPYFLNLAFKCGLSPWAIVVLTVGSQLACNAGEAGLSRVALRVRRASPSRKNQALENKVDNAIRRRGSSGSGGVLFGVATALAYLHPTAQMIGGVPLLVPLWPVIPLLLCTDLGLLLRYGLKRDVRRVLETSRSRSGGMGSFGHVAGAEFGLLFAILKFRLGLRI